MRELADIYPGVVVVDEEDPVTQYIRLMEVTIPFECEYGTGLEACVYAEIHQRNIVIYHETTLDDNMYHLDMTKFVSKNVGTTCLLHCNGRSHYKLMDLKSTSVDASVSKNKNVIMGEVNDAGEMLKSKFE